MNRFTAMQERIGTSIIDLLLLRICHFLTFKKLSWFEKEINKVRKELETVSNRKVF
ncbi:hypothetical protein [Terrihalobacillus insolitus]|uniref:hypothetical protein n=1 Tax=Terrihalobacillus insolitus TaxID=2950438 RepID=UPI002341B99F|nr:hypothetical protein [Terrihalobacillus insolitus]MDC3414756.1 hypothetical protein [Terrihalobacillus insolitus]